MVSVQKQSVAFVIVVAENVVKVGEFSSTFPVPSATQSRGLSAL